MLTLLLLGKADFSDGYIVKNGYIEFVYPSNNPNLKVYVSGNFNGWTKSDESWRLTFNPTEKHYLLRKPVAGVRTANRSFYEFTYRVNDTLMDADSRARNVIHCAGYGYRYVIKWD